MRILKEKNAEFISTNRLAGLKKGSMTIVHFVGNRMLTFFGNVLFGTRIIDTHSGMWIFKKNCLKKLNLTSDGMPFSPEIKFEAAKKLRFLEIPIIYRRRVGKVKLKTIKDGVKHLFFLLYKRIIF